MYIIFIGLFKNYLNFEHTICLKRSERNKVNIPNDPIILLSYVNTQLRDNFNSLEDFCKTNNIEIESIINKLSNVGYIYDSTQNRFR